MPEHPIEFDIVAVDKDDRFILVGEAKTRKIDDEDHQQMAQSMGRLVDVIPFVMFADPGTIQLFHWDGKELSGPASTLSTRDVLQYYEPEFERGRIFEWYLVSLVEAWLRDLAYHWKSDSPPGTDELKKAGLLQKLEGGTTVLHGEARGAHLRNLR